MTNQQILSRPRRNRKTDSIREMIRETWLHPSDLILPLFVVEGQNLKIEIESMPDCYRLSPDLIVEEAKSAQQLGIPAVALFPALSDLQKDHLATESTNPNGLLQRTVRLLKSSVPAITVVTDVAMDPYSIDGHDGLVEDGRILNDPTLEILAKMALSQAEAGSDIIAPSDMMDGRVGYIRKELDKRDFSDVSILSYSAKYASAFYGPFRDALDSAPKEGDKKTYQMDPANRFEALREVFADVNEGADLVMVKPALAYLDIISDVKASVNLPVVAYNVSGEYAMIKSAAQMGWLDETATMMETLIAIKRSGADLILTYFAKSVAELLSV
ncbi:porphobilinogen synthase [Candidatus Poribacteria bacterium]|mgnify:FL=1|nr:porphobilinogen synthase [Candidatus Poribacteria bacterium]OUT61024.1 MAG: delta-aminolevulinic acid dehydratase [bacterium TMED15]